MSNTGYIFGSIILLSQAASHNTFVSGFLDVHIPEIAQKSGERPKHEKCATDQFGRFLADHRQCGWRFLSGVDHGVHPVKEKRQCEQFQYVSIPKDRWQERSRNRQCQ